MGFLFSLNRDGMIMSENFGTEVFGVNPSLLTPRHLAWAVMGIDNIAL